MDIFINCLWSFYLDGEGGLEHEFYLFILSQMLDTFKGGMP